MSTTQTAEVSQSLSLPGNNTWQPEPATLLKNNQAWAAFMEREYPGFLKRSAEGQAPKVMWIGCSDSRVPESVITNVLPGAIFVQRNIANQFLYNDVSAQAALGYATDEKPDGLGSKHVIVVGHSRCGGVGFAMGQAHGRLASDLGCEFMARTSFLEEWLGPLIALVKQHPGATLEEMIDLNVRQQVQTVKRALVATGKGEVKVHGWVYDLATGLLRELTCL